MTTLHNKDNLDDNCKRLIKINDDHVPIAGSRNRLFNQWVQEPKHNICYKCFTTVVINNIDI